MSVMTFYVAVVAILNLVLGFMLAEFLRSRRHDLALGSGGTVDNFSEYQDNEEDWET